MIAGLVAYAPAQSAIRAPTLLIGGDKDSGFAVQEQRSLERKIAGARLQILNGVGHTPHWENPEQFVSQLLRFLSPS